jgi:hypothetical protein
MTILSLHLKVKSSKPYFKTVAILLFSLIFLQCKHYKYVSDLCEPHINGVMGGESVVCLPAQTGRYNQRQKIVLDFGQASGVIAPTIKDSRKFALYLKNFLLQKKVIKLPDAQQGYYKDVTVDLSALTAFTKKYQSTHNLYLTYCDIDGCIKEDENILLVLTYFCDDNKVVRIDGRTGQYYTYSSYFKFNHTDSLQLIQNKKEFWKNEK